MRRVDTFGRILITVGCVYETIALWNKRLPTITAMNHKGWMHPHPKFKVLAALWLLIWTEHFLHPLVVSVRKPHPSGYSWE